jgi:hypothetical protein
MVLYELLLCGRACRNKGDQEGSRIFPTHIYANPLCPELCPILSLAIYVFCQQFHESEDGNSWKLFNGNKLENCFSNWLHNLLLSEFFNEAEFGASARKFGTHSFR